MTRTVTVVTVGDVVERGDLVRGFEEVEFVPSRELLDGRALTGDTVVQVGGGDAAELAKELAAVLDRIHGDTVRVVVDARLQATEGERAPGGGESEAQSLAGPGRREKKASGGSSGGGRRKSARSGAKKAGKGRGRAKGPARPAPLGFGRSRAGLLGRWFPLAGLLLAAVLGWRIFAHTEDWILALTAWLAASVSLAWPVLLGYANRSLKPIRQSAGESKRALRAIRADVRTLSRSIDRVAGAQSRSAAVASMNALTLDELVRREAKG